MKGKLILIVLAVMLMASVSSAALFKFGLEDTDGDFAEGDVVYVDGSGTLDKATSATPPDLVIGLVVQVEGDTALVANSGIIDFQLPDQATVGPPVLTAITAGDRLYIDKTVAGGVTTRTALTARTDSVEYIAVGIALEDYKVGNSKVMIQLSNIQAKYSTFDNSTADLKLADSTIVSNVQEAIEALEEMIGGLLVLADNSNPAANIPDATWVDVAEVDFSAAHGGQGVVPANPIFLHFNGTFDDQGQGTDNGAYISVRIVDDNATVQVGPMEVILIDRNFHQAQEVTLSKKITPTEDFDVFTVQAQRKSAPYDDGRFVAGTFTAWELTN